MSEMPSVWRPDLLKHVEAVIRDDIARGKYFGAVLKVARAGKVGLEVAIGDEGGAGTKPLAGSFCWGGTEKSRSSDPSSMYGPDATRNRP